MILEVIRSYLLSSIFYRTLKTWHTPMVHNLFFFKCLQKFSQFNKKNARVPIGHSGSVEQPEKSRDCCVQG